ncbi:MAG: ATP synthase F1 subunit epsilon [Candidatus Paceibacterota bacterium]
MSTHTLQLNIITPEKVLFQGRVKQVTLPTEHGVITVLPKHVPIIAKLRSGDIVGEVDSEFMPFAVTGGFVEVKRRDGDTEVNILADFAEHVADLTEDKIAEARDRAEKIKKDIQEKSDIDYEYFATELERSVTQIKIADKWGARKYRR